MVIENIKLIPRRWLVDRRNNLPITNAKKAINIDVIKVIKRAHDYQNLLNSLKLSAIHDDNQALLDKLENYSRDNLGIKPTMIRLTRR